jgi:hypothetical protein
MKEQRADVFFFYHQKREALVRLALILVVFFFVLCTLARARGGALNDPWQILGGAIDNGYMLIFGPLAIFLCTLWFNRCWKCCLAIRAGVLDSVKRGDLGEHELNDFERVLSARPFVKKGTTRFSRFRNFCLLRFVPFTGLVATALLLQEYFQLLPRKTQDSSWTAIVFGVPPFTDGFDPIWSRFPELDLPWVYPPWFTLIYIAMAGYLLNRTIHPFQGHKNANE